MTVRIINADVMDGLKGLPDESVHCCVTSPPYYGLRDYGVDGQIGLEATPEAFITRLVDVFREVRRVLRKDGTCWVNMGDSYNNFRSQMGPGQAVHGRDKLNGKPEPDSKRRGVLGLKEKDLLGIPWMLAFALRADGWWLRQDIIWHKPNPMPESVTDRCTKAHEYMFLLTKSARYFYDAEAVKEAASENTHSRGNGVGPKNAGNSPESILHNGNYARRINGAVPDRNKRSVWTIATAPFAEAHFATFPPELPEICIKAGTSQKGCCAQCGAPWVRETDVSYDNPGNRTTNGPRSVANREITAGFAQRLEKHVVTTGWSPSCSCNAAVTPCTVLDIFAGAGTTLMVADRLQRHGIGIELNPTYAAMAEKRVNGDRGALLDMMEAAAE